MVWGFRLASTTGMKVTDTVKSIGSKLPAAENMPDLLSWLWRAHFIDYRLVMIWTIEWTDSRRASDDDVSSVAVFDDEQARLVVVIEHIGLVHAL